MREDRHITRCCSARGNLFVVLGTGIVFQRSQGRWHYLNYMNAHRCLEAFLSPRVVTAVLRAALDLSFEGIGALFCIPTRRTSVDSMIKDHEAADRPNRALRESLRGLKITRWEQRQVIAASAATDGAVVLTRSGSLLDIACMIVTPKPERIRKVTGSEAPQTFGGSRSTAAWNASMYGLSLKVSEDGPITIYRLGKEIYRLGGGG